MIRAHRGIEPKIAASAYIDPSAQVIGDVEVGERSSIWPNATVRGDVHRIRIGRRTNIQDGAIVHVMRDTHPTTIGDEVTNMVFFDDVWVSDDYRVGELNHGFQYISEALDLERFTMFTFSPIEGRVELLCRYVATEERDGRPLREDPVIRKRIAQLVTQTEVARVLGLRFVAKSIKGGAPPTVEASSYKLFATTISQRVANEAMDIGGPASQLRVGMPDAPMQGRADSSYRCTVVETIGGGSSEIQKNIIARRKLGLPKNF